MNTITLVLPYPISANRYWATRTVTPKGGKPMAMTYVTPEAKAFKADVTLAAWRAGVRAPLAGRVRLELWLYPHRPQDWQKRLRQLGANWDDGVRAVDLDNANKITLDALKGIAFEDDVWVRQLTSQRMEPDDKPARVVVRITQIETAQPQGALL